MSAEEMEEGELDPALELAFKEPWRARGYKLAEEVESPEEWEGYVRKAEESFRSADFLRKMLAKHTLKKAEDVAHVVALRRRLQREFKAETAVELMLIDLLVANYQQQCDWHEILGQRTYILHKREATYGGRPRPGGVESIDLDGLADRVLPILDRLNRQFLRTVKAMRDLKSSSLIVNINQAGQVNVGNEQINLSKSEPE